MFLAAASAFAQDKPKSPDFDAKVEAVRVDVLASDRFGRPLKDLTQADFRIFEDGVEQKIQSFFPLEAPFAVGLILDTSLSTVGKLRQIQNNAVRFIDQLHPDDEVMVISFDDEVYLDSDFTPSRDIARKAVRGTRTGESTQLYDAVYLGLEQMERHSARRVMVLFSDGVDTTSRTTDSKDTLDFAKEANVLIYTILFDTQEETVHMVRQGQPFPGAGRRSGWPTPTTIPGQGPGPFPDGNPLPIPNPAPPMPP